MSVKEWVRGNRTSWKSGKGRQNVTPARDDVHLIRVAVTERTASSGQLAER